MPEHLGLESEAGAPFAVFISHASQDKAVADLLCARLEAAGINCWIAPRNVRPGDLYADAIVHAINGCRILVLILSQSAASSGHVLREVERASAKKRPIVSLRIDAAGLPPALEYFLSASQWLDADAERLDAILPGLVQALREHLGSSSASATAAKIPLQGHAPRARRTAVGLAVAIAVGLACFALQRIWWPKQAPPARPARSATPAAPAAAATPTVFAPAPHSIAVLPFANLSGNPNDQYFSDGLSEELLNSLATIRDLQVAARTSSFSFKGSTAGIDEIARKLNVATILEGSIRKEGKHVRIAAQLIDASTGFSIWSNSYDRDLKDILKLQAEIATAVTTSLRATLLENAATLVELGGTQNPDAFDAYLRGEKGVGMPVDEANSRAQIAAYTEAVRIDPRFAKAYMGMALAQIILASNSASSSEARAVFGQARAAAQKAVALAPDLGEAHSVLGFALDAGFQKYSEAAAEHERALALSPGNSRVLLISARFLAEIGRADAAIAHARRAVVLDPLNAGAYRILGLVFLYTHHYSEAISAYDRALSMNPHAVQAASNRGLALAALGQPEGARQSCARPPLDWLSRVCLAIVLNRLNRADEAQAQLAALRASAQDESDLAYQYAQIYAQWGNVDKALDSLDIAYRARDPGLLQLKVDNLMDPLRSNPRFGQILKNMNFPD
jgi:TolB-like protein/Flp pilus assembly protein TadD